MLKFADPKRGWHGGTRPGYPAKRLRFMTLDVWPANPNLRWRLVTDAVMGGASNGTLAKEKLEGREAALMRGDISTDNNGGFIQMALDLAPGGISFDASAFTGLEIDVLGNGESYGAHLRTEDMTRPQQSYRQGFVAAGQWQTLRLPFLEFAPHRIDIPLNTRRIMRIGLVAIGRKFAVHLAVARLAFYRSGRGCGRPREH